MPFFPEAIFHHFLLTFDSRSTSKLNFFPYPDRIYCNHQSHTRERTAEAETKTKNSRGRDEDEQQRHKNGPKQGAKARAVIERRQIEIKSSAYLFLSSRFRNMLRRQSKKGKFLTKWSTKLATMGSQSEIQVSAQFLIRWSYQVASPITGIPPSWLRNLCKPHLVDLREGLQKILAVQTHAITVITNALSRQRPPNGNGSRPIGSFLLLSDFVHGRLVLAEALANQLYDDQCHVMSFDISDDKDLHEYEGIVGGKLIEGVKNRLYSVLMLENFDGANKRTIEVVQQIIEGGQLM